MAGDGVKGCTTVAYRPAHGSFTTGYESSPCEGKNGNTLQGIAAAGDGYAALITEYTTDTSPPGSLYVQLGRFGRFGHFGAPHRLSLLGTSLPGSSSASPDPGNLNRGVSADRRGVATVAWQGCASDSCMSRGIYAQTGSVASGFVAPPTLIASSRPHTQLDGLVADGAVAVKRCAPRQQCTIAVALARADGGGFLPSRQITKSGRRLLSLQSDGRGDLLLVYGTYRGELYAVTEVASARRFGAPHRLSGPGVTASSVTSAFGPRGEAIVAWSQRRRTIASVYVTPATGNPDWLPRSSSACAAPSRSPD